MFSGAEEAGEEARRWQLQRTRASLDNITARIRRVSDVHAIAHHPRLLLPCTHTHARARRASNDASMLADAMLKTDMCVSLVVSGVHQGSASSEQQQLQQQQQQEQEQLADLLRHTGYTVWLESAQDACARVTAAPETHEGPSPNTQPQPPSPSSLQQEVQHASSSAGQPDLIVLLLHFPQSQQHSSTAKISCLPQNIDAAPSPPPPPWPSLAQLRALASKPLPPVVLALGGVADPACLPKPFLVQALEAGACDVLSLPMRRQEASMLWQHVFKAQLVSLR